MTEDRWISVDKRSSNLVIRFYVKGLPKQCFVSTGLKDTERNRAIVRLRRDAIATDIALGRFDPTLNSYQFKDTNQLDPTASALQTSKSKQ